MGHLCRMSTLLALSAFAIFSSVRAYAQQYTISDLGTVPGGQGSEALGINSAGQIVGFAVTSSGTDHAFLYSNGVMTDLGTLGGAYSQATAINNNGQIVGWSDVGSSYHSFLYSGGTMTDISANMGYWSQALAINNSGQIVGFFNDGQADQGYLYSQGSVTTLGSLGGNETEATGINDSGQIVGTSELPYPQQFEKYDPFLYTGGQIHDLGTFGGFYTGPEVAINAKGDIAGTLSPPDSNEEEAFLYSNGVTKPIGIFYAAAINDTDQIVGDAFYSDGMIHSLSSLLPANSGWALSQANGINDAGQIVGYGINPEGQTDGFLLTPVPEPKSTGLLLLAGTISFLLRRRTLKAVRFRGRRSATTGSDDHRAIRQR